MCVYIYVRMYVFTKSSELKAHIDFCFICVAAAAAAALLPKTLITSLGSATSKLFFPPSPGTRRVSALNTTPTQFQLGRFSHASSLKLASTQ